LGAAGAVVYFYNTTDIFAEEATSAVQNLTESEPIETEQLPTLDAIAEERKRRRAEEAERAAIKAAYEENLRREQEQQRQQEGGEEETGAPGGGVAALQEEADQQGAFNPETGEINWDCPCLGGMADGPCGEEFKAAFSCFVFSTEEPKGMDCVEKFKYVSYLRTYGDLLIWDFRGMQNCFRQYPEIYGSELDADDEEEGAADMLASESANSQDDREGRQERAQVATEQVSQQHADAEKHYIGPATTKDTESDVEAKRQRSKAATEQVKRNHGQPPLSESDEAIPKQWHDASDANVEKK
jgi:intermembrane space import and assembly protein 40